MVPDHDQVAVKPSDSLSSRRIYPEQHSALFKKVRVCVSVFVCLVIIFNSIVCVCVCLCLSAWARVSMFRHVIAGNCVFSFVRARVFCIYMKCVQDLFLRLRSVFDAMMVDLGGHMFLWW